MIDEKIIKNKLNEIKIYTSVKNWDGFDSDPLESVLFDKVINLISDLKLEFSTLDQPNISPCSDRTIHLNWRTLEFKFLVEVGLNQYDWFYISFNSQKNSEEGICKDKRSIADICRKFIGPNSIKANLNKKHQTRIL